MNRDPEKTTLFTNLNVTVIVSTLGEHFKDFIFEETITLLKHPEIEC